VYYGCDCLSQDFHVFFLNVRFIMFDFQLILMNTKLADISVICVSSAC
jgi:hypothetical protein